MAEAVVEGHWVDLVEIVLVLGLVTRHELLKVDLLVSGVTRSVGAANHTSFI